MAASKQVVTHLYRDMLRSAAGFKDYNFRSYALRRVKEEWHAAKNVEAAAVPELLTFAAEQAGMLKRQSIINSMYSQHSSVMQSYGATA